MIILGAIGPKGIRGDGMEGQNGEPGEVGDKGPKGYRGDPGKLPLGSEFKDLKGDIGKILSFNFKSENSKFCQIY